MRQAALRLVTLLVVTLIIASPDAMAAERRVALVIGNNDYAHVTRLKKAVNDARAMSTSLQRLGFNVTQTSNVTRRELNFAVQQFLNQIEPGDMAMIYYAGHGVEISGENFLLPIDIPDATPGQEGFVRNESISLNDILIRLKARKARLNVIILDACRNNPFSKTAGRSLGATRGLAGVAAPQGTFVMYSADAGEEALDALSETDNSPNSVFTRTLIPMLQKPGLNLVDVARQVRRQVRKLALSVSHQQTPAYYDAVLGDFYFNGKGNKPANASTLTAPAPAPASPSTLDTISNDFDIAKSLGTKAAWETFLATHGNKSGSFYVKMARAQLDAVNKRVAAVSKAAQQETRAISTKLPSFTLNAKGGMYRERTLVKENDSKWNTLRVRMQMNKATPTEKWGAALSLGIRESKTDTNSGKIYLRISKFDSDKTPSVKIQVYEGNKRLEDHVIYKSVKLGQRVDVEVAWPIPGVVTFAINGEQRKRIKVPWKVSYVSMIGSGGDYAVDQIALSAR